MNLTFTLMGIIAAALSFLLLKDYIWLGLFTLVLGMFVDACTYQDSKNKENKSTAQNNTNLTKKPDSLVKSTAQQ